jgi:hypothetical protein
MFRFGAAINRSAIFLVQHVPQSTTGCYWGIPGLHGTQRMSKARALLPQHHRLMTAACFLCMAGFVAWSTATAFGKAPSVQRPALKPTPVQVSVSTLDMSRLVPAQFGDWDAAAKSAR